MDKRLQALKFYPIHIVHEFLHDKIRQLIKCDKRNLSWDRKVKQILRITGNG